MRLYRLKGKTDKGRNTEGVVDLNNSTRLVKSRFEIGEKIAVLIESAWDRFKIHQNSPNTSVKNRLIGGIEGILEECQPASSYAATTSTILFTDQRFQELVAAMKEVNMWTDDLVQLFQSAEGLVLECA